MEAMNHAHVYVHLHDKEEVEESSSLIRQPGHEVGNCAENDGFSQRNRNMAGNASRRKRPRRVHAVADVAVRDVLAIYSGRHFRDVRKAQGHAHVKEEATVSYREKHVSALDAVHVQCPHYRLKPSFTEPWKYIPPSTTPYNRTKSDHSVAQKLARTDAPLKWKKQCDTPQTACCA